MGYLMAYGLAAWQQLGQFVNASEPVDDRSRYRSITDKDDTFVDKDDHCGVHLIKNALGGSRRGLFESVMSLRPPTAEKVRGDFSVIVTFFDDKVKLPKVEGNQMHSEAYTWQATLGNQPR
jgi:hypothetical protein